MSLEKSSGNAVTKWLKVDAKNGFIFEEKKKDQDRWDALSGVLDGCRYRYSEPTQVDGEQYPERHEAQLYIQTEDGLMCLTFNMRTGVGRRYINRLLGISPLAPGAPVRISVWKGDYGASCTIQPGKDQESYPYKYPKADPGNFVGVPERIDTGMKNQWGRPVWNYGPQDEFWLKEFKAFAEQFANQKDDKAAEVPISGKYPEPGTYDPETANPKSQNAPQPATPAADDFDETDDLPF